MAGSRLNQLKSAWSAFLLVFVIGIVVGAVASRVIAQDGAGTAPLVSPGTVAPGTKSTITQRLAAVQLREERAKRREVAVQRREVAVEVRERNVKKREEDVAKREQAMQQLEALVQQLQETVQQLAAALLECQNGGSAP